MFSCSRNGFSEMGSFPKRLLRNGFVRDTWFPNTRSATRPPPSTLLPRVLPCSGIMCQARPRFGNLFRWMEAKLNWARLSLFSCFVINRRARAFRKTRRNDKWLLLFFCSFHSQLRLKKTQRKQTLRKTSKTLKIHDMSRGLETVISLRSNKTKKRPASPG